MGTTKTLNCEFAHFREDEMSSDCWECHKDARLSVEYESVEIHHKKMSVYVCEECSKKEDQTKLKKIHGFNLTSWKDPCYMCKQEKNIALTVQIVHPLAGKIYIQTSHNLKICQKCFDEKFINHIKKDGTEKRNKRDKEFEEYQLEKQRKKYPFKVTLEYEDRYEILEGDDAIKWSNWTNNALIMQSVRYGNENEKHQFNNWKKIMK